ncbi:MAG: lamin tail domain-containing protein [Spirochaetia bacterium]|nr:lamin tail domain-containing protein [Spirochaetia bacterium]
MKYNFFYFLLFLSCAYPLFEDPGQSNEEFEIIFNKAAQDPEHKLYQSLIGLIENTSSSLSCAFSEYPDDLIFEKINENKSINTRLVFDYEPNIYEERKDISFLNENNNNIKNIYGNSGEGIQKNNWCISDKEKIWYSTLPPVFNIINKKYGIGFLIYSKNNEIINEFIKEINLFEEDIFGTNKSKTDLKNSFSILNQKIKLIWGPHENPLEVLGDIINSAQNDIHIFSTGIYSTNTDTENDIIEILNKKTESNLTINAVLDSIVIYDSFNVIQNLNSQVNLFYLETDRGVPSTQLFLIDKEKENSKLILYSGVLRKKTDTDDDSLLVILEGSYVSKLAFEYFSNLKELSMPLNYTPYYAAEPNKHEIAINEISWMGSVNNDGALFNDDEFIELYNTTSDSINIGGWIFACRKDDLNITGGPVKIPYGVELKPNDFFLIAADYKNVLNNAKFINTLGSYGISAEAVECILTDGNPEVTVSTNAYSDNGVTGTIVDTAGDGATTFDFALDKAYSPFGINAYFSNSELKIRRTMERVESDKSGTNIYNWKTNSFTIEENIFVNENFKNQTFASPGFQNSPRQQVNEADVIINEILYMGSYLNDGTSISTDEFIELYNNTNKDIHLGGWMFACTNDITDIEVLGSTNANSFFAIPFGTVIHPNQYFVIADHTGDALTSAHLITTSLGITNTSSQCILTDGTGGINTNIPYPKQPLLRGFIIDKASDGSSSFSSLAFGQNTTIRKSMERQILTGTGDNQFIWSSNIFDTSQNIYIHTNFNEKTFASPGVQNSVFIP